MGVLSVCRRRRFWRGRPWANRALAVSRCELSLIEELPVTLFSSVIASISQIDPMLAFRGGGKDQRLAIMRDFDEPTPGRSAQRQIPE